MPYTPPNNYLTNLVITPLDAGHVSPVVIPYSARGLSQTLEQITGISGAAGQVGGIVVRRDINGNLQNVTYTQFQKYMSTIQCKDQDVPALDNAWTGATVQVDCVHELTVAPGGGVTRTIVPGSEFIDDQGYTHYRPRLTMMIMHISSSRDEYGHEYSWKMDLQEV